jgi:bifunctional UDP-N-acetylglucosamine pyrophosphorylase/glucosamine-1-phosphate N-acetyltransferase
MQAVILAAGRGKRMKALTDNMPKPLLTVFGNNLIEHKIAILPKEVDEVIIVIGYLGEKIKQHFGEEFGGKKITYVEQKELLGTMLALKEAEGVLRGRFIVMMGDDLYSKEDVDRCLEHPWAILVKKMEEGGRGARVSVDSKNHIVDITEGVELEKGMLNNAGMYVLQTEIFNYPLVQIPSGEFGLPQTLAKVAKDSNISVVESKNWQQISSPEDLEKVEKIFSEAKSSEKKAGSKKRKKD